MFMTNFEKTKNEKYAEKFLNVNGFVILSCKQYQSKTYYIVEKDGIEDVVSIPYCVSDINSYMKMIKSSFEMKVECIKKGLIKR